jgi:hypothetical protein
LRRAAGRELSGQLAVHGPGIEHREICIDRLDCLPNRREERQRIALGSKQNRHLRLRPLAHRQVKLSELGRFTWIVVAYRADYANNRVLHALATVNIVADLLTNRVPVWFGWLAKAAFSVL